MKLLPLWLVTVLLHGYIAAGLVPGLQAFPGGQGLLPGDSRPAQLSRAK